MKYGAHTKLVSHGAGRSAGFSSAIWPLVVFAVLVVVSLVLVNAEWGFYHGLLLAVAGLVMFCFPLKRGFPKGWWVLFGGYFVLSLAQFLPVAWFSSPDWRQQLEQFGVNTGNLVVVQTRQAAEYVAVFSGCLWVCLWAVSQRAGKEGVRRLVLACVGAIACYALWAKSHQAAMNAATGHVDELYGLFPNRNHTASLLAMGAVAGCGCVFQGLRDRRFVSMFIALAASVVILLGLANWSVSRAGVVLFVVGAGLWVPLVGLNYLGRHGRKALALLLVTAVGAFFLMDSRVKERISETVKVVEAEKNDALLEDGEILPPRAMSHGTLQKEFRLVVAGDVMKMVADFPVTGVGSGQFRHVFPMYRDGTAKVNDQYLHHPESDWLWLLAEQGVPAGLCLLVLVVWIFASFGVDLRKGDAWALRAACFVAAAIVPLHGVFDVPGHRVTLMWFSALLLACSATPRESRDELRGNALMLRVGAGFVLLVGIGLLWLTCCSDGGAATTLSERVLRDSEWETNALREEIAASRQAGREVTTENISQWLARGSNRLDAAVQALPLDRGLREKRGIFTIYRRQDLAAAERDFHVVELLDPTTVSVAVRHGFYFANVDPFLTGQHWREALRRARWLDERDPGTIFGQRRVLGEIQYFTKKKPNLQALRQQFGLE